MTKRTTTADLTPARGIFAALILSLPIWAATLAFWWAIQ